MIKYIVIRNFRGTCSSVKMLKGYMLISVNAEGVHGKRKVRNPWYRGWKHYILYCLENDNFKTAWI